jgi:hypothetical protein
MTFGRNSAVNSLSPRGVAQSGSAFGWGPKGRWFKSSRPDLAEAGFDDAGYLADEHRRPRPLALFTNNGFPPTTEKILPCVPTSPGSPACRTSTSRDEPISQVRYGRRSATAAKTESTCTERTER